MAHTKAQGAANRLVNMTGRRLGLKRASGQFVTAGTIIIRQQGTKFHPGKNTGIGRDYTIFATKEGYVSFRNMTGNHRGQKYIDIADTRKEDDKKPAVKTKAKSKTTTKPVAKKDPVKKVATKKVAAKKTVKK